MFFSFGEIFIHPHAVNEHPQQNEQMGFSLRLNGDTGYYRRFSPCAKIKHDQNLTFPSLFFLQETDGC